MLASRRLKRGALALAAPAAVFVVLLFTLERVNGSESPAAPATAAQPSEASGGDPLSRDTGALVTNLEGAVAEDPGNAEAYGLLGDALYQQFRETADPTLIQRAQEAFDQALQIEPGNETATIGQGTLALTKHDFRDGLELGRKAHRLAPDLVRPLNLITDAQVELGRYPAAAKTLQRFVSVKPTLASYSRVSYFRELHGDIDGALQAMRLAVSTGGGGEPLAYVQTLLGRLELDRGKIGAAEIQYRRALSEVPGGYTPALAGLARVDAARGQLDSAIRRYRKVVERLPLPEYAIALAEAELAAGRRTAAERDLRLVTVEEKLFRSSGVDVGTELAIFEADHGRPARAVAFGREAWRRAPSVRSADAYSWALNSAGRTKAAFEMSRRAMRLGSRDPVFLYHAGQISLAAGEKGRAREMLGTLVAQSPRFNPLYGPRAARALESLR